ncbi:MAG: alpha-2-macroglobulin family protein [Prevotella sp.]
MKRLMTIMVLGLAMLTTASYAQNYSALWKQVKTAQDKDLPNTEYDLLLQIADKAEAEKAYGQLMKARIQAVNAINKINTDSLLPAVKRVENAYSKASDKALKAVYAAVLYKIYDSAGNRLDTDNDKAHETKAAEYRKAAIADVNMLGKTKAGIFEPMIVEGGNANIFGGDLLSVIGNETRQYLPMYEYYNKNGNRRAACISAMKYIQTEVKEDAGKYAVKKSPFVFALDSVLHIYEDLDVAGEVAIARYQAMTRCKDVSVEDRIGYIHYALDKWGEWQGMGQLRNAEKELTRSMFTAEIDKSVKRPGIDFWVKLNKVRNVGTLTMNIFKVDVDGSKNYLPSNSKDLKFIKSRTTEYPFMTKTANFGGIPNYQIVNDSIKVEGLQRGVYLVEVSSNPATATSRQLLWISDLMTITQSLPGNKMKFVVVDATSGQPVGGAKINVKQLSANAKNATLTCDANGEAIFEMDGRSSIEYYTYTADDKACLKSSIWSGFNFNDSDGRTEEEVNIFTDRSIYRPGQKVKVAAIVYAKDSWTKARALEGKKMTVVMRDANRNVVDEQEVTTDKYGTLSAEFNLPEGGMSGNYRITVGNSSARIRVEEYKRPTFKVEFPTINTRYQGGDTLSIEAKAVSYAGVPVQGAKVKYRVVRRPSLWWSPWYRTDDSNIIIKEEETITDGDGRFDVSLPLILPEETGVRRFYNFTVEADVTDISGETHSGEMSIPLGSRPTAISSSVTDKELGDSLKSVTVYLKNQAGIDVNTPVRMRIDEGEWLEGRTMTPIMLPKQLLSGKHSLYALCDSDTLRQEFVVFNLSDTRPCTDTDQWFYLSSERFADSNSAVTFQAGSSRDNVHVVYTIIAGNKVIESGRENISNALINRTFKYKEAYGNGLLLNYAWVKAGMIMTTSKTIQRPLPDNHLKMKWTTFRDRLVPGQKEQWTMSILGSNGKPADAQLMATLYDASLDQLVKHRWNFNVSLDTPLPYTSWETAYRQKLMFSASARLSKLNFTLLQLSHFDEQLFSYDANRYTRFGQVMMKGAMLASATPAMVGEGNMVAVEEMAMADGANIDMKAAKETATEDEPNEEVIRENMNETAFFFPNIIADKKGDAVISFTLPETLTSWRFMGLAHTPGMSFGLLEGETVAQKEIMVQPNMPRFVRMGDKTTIAAKIFNTGNAKAEGEIRMELSDPETGKVIMSDSKPFGVELNKTTAVTFDFAPTEDTPALVVCKIVANGKSATGNAFSDGEQHYLPILPNKERVTETVSFTQTDKGVKTVNIDKLLPVKDNSARLTVEYTNNPAWMMVQALPSIATANENNVIDQSTSLYANMIGRHIAESNPKIRSVFCLWKEEARNGGESLMSNLSRNSELKNLLLSETPWMTDADKEEDIKRSLGDFFDDNTMNARISSAIDKLGRLQNSDGSWSWWKGMQGSAYMTANVMQTIARMEMMTGENEAVKQMKTHAYTFLDKEIVEDVKLMKKEKRAYFNSLHLQYLYTNAIDARQLQGEVKAAADYLIALMKKEIKEQSIYDKAMTAVILARNGERRLAAEYIKSLKEYTTYKEDMGRYFETQRAGYSWCDYRIPTQVAAIEALTLVAPKEQQTIAEMQRWLLQEKRGQMWSTPINSVNAVYAFLMSSTDMLAPKEETRITIDGKPMDMPKATAGMGYVKTATKADKKMKNISFDKTSEGTSWGAVYAQYMQKATDVRKSGEGLSVKREIILPKEGLKVGAKVKVRITVTADRDLDFVQIIDRRAACMQPVEQLTGYRNGIYCSPKDNTTNFYLNAMPKGKRVIETEYYIDRTGTYQTGTCSAQCAYSPEFSATVGGEEMKIER